MGQIILPKAFVCVFLIFFSQLYVQPCNNLFNAVSSVLSVWIGVKVNPTLTVYGKWKSGDSVSRKRYADSHKIHSNKLQCRKQDPLMAGV